MSGPRPSNTLSHFLRRRLALAGSAVVLLVSAALYLNLAQLRNETLARQMAVTAELSASQFTSMIDDHLGVIALLAAETRDAPGWQEALRQTSAHFGLFVSMLAAGPSGAVIAGVSVLESTDPTFVWTDQNVADRAYFRVAASSRAPHVSGVFASRGLDTLPIIALSAPQVDGDGKLLAVVQGSVLTETYAARRAEALRQRGQALLVLDAERAVVFASDSLVWSDLDKFPHDLSYADLTRPLPQRLAAAFEDGDDGLYQAAHTRHGWTIVILQPAQSVRAVLLRDAVNLLLPSLLTLAAVAFAAHLMARMLSRPIRLLTARIRGFAQDRQPTNIPTSGAPVELQELGDAFNVLTHELGATISTLDAALLEQRRLGATLEATLSEREQEIADRTSELREANRQLSRQAVTDELTACLNYRGFRQRLQEVWDECAQRGVSLGAIAFDVDHFKRFNDRYGHPAGDVCLQRVAASMRVALSGGHDVLGRVGGEEFSALLPDTGNAALLVAAERLRDTVAHSGIPHADAPAGHVTVSVGIALMMPRPGVDPGSLLEAADAALYRAKQTGRNRVSE